MALTLTQKEILMDIIKSFSLEFPALHRMGLDLRPGRLKLNQEYIAHIAGFPTVADYDAAQGGYKNGAVEARGLLTDVPITVNAHKHVPLKWTHLDAIKDNKRRYDEVIANAGFTLAEYFMNDLMAGVTAANFSKTQAVATADFDLDVITDISGKMTLNKADVKGRTLLVNTAVANVIGADTRIASRDYYGQMAGGTALRRWTNVGGFAEIIEVPSLPANGEALCAFAFEKRAFSVLQGIPEGFQDELAAQLGIPRVMGYESVTEPTSGITMAAVSWQEAGTGDFFWSPTLVWGKRLGKAGGAAGTGTDVAGYRITASS